MKLTVKLSSAFFALAFATVASAQVMPGLSGNNLLPFQPMWSQTFPNNVPTVGNGTWQANYPYPGQCIANGANAVAFPGLPACTGGSFTPDPTFGKCDQSIGSWIDCATVKPYWPLLPISSQTLAASAIDVKFQHEVLNPPDYTPDQVTYGNADYYEIGLHEAMGFNVLSSVGAFPDPAAASNACGGAACPAHPFTGGVPDGMQWTGLRCNLPGGCACRADYSTGFCPTGSVPEGTPLYTQIWGVGQINMNKTLGIPLTPNPSAWSQNDYIATWPSISIRGTRGRPVVVKWVNEFPNNHVFCAHPEAADWPCAIDRTFMGVRATIDPAIAPAGVSPDKVNEFGSPQQPDNSWVTHLHGGEIPPSTDGFAEKWYGNNVTGALYAPTPKFVSPPFENPSGIHLKRPAGAADTYTYPMIQDEALIWFHDHTLGKTHHNVIAGPAGFFPVKDPARHGAVTWNLATSTSVCTPGGGQTDCRYTWLDPITEPRGALGIPKYDLFLAIQDRAFSEDGSINFSNGLGQLPGLTPADYGTSKTTPLACIAAGTCSAAGTTPVTAGANPQVHPVWVPEYFGDHVLVNGVLWPKKTVGKGWYRIRVVDGSDSRCWTVGLSTLQPQPGVLPTNNVPMYIVAGDQGYSAKPVRVTEFTMCPGERYEFLVHFGQLPLSKDALGNPVPATNVWMTNKAGAPYPFGEKPQDPGSPFVDTDTIMRFDLDPAIVAVPTCPSTGTMPFRGFNWPNPANGVGCIPSPIYLPADPAILAEEAALRPPPTATFQQKRDWTAGGVVRMVYLNEKLDGQTGAPFGMQLNGVPFEYKVTETPKQDSIEVWKFINLTVDAHPMHPHLVRHLVVHRMPFSTTLYKSALCGSTSCQPGTVPGNEMVAVPDVTPFLSTTGIYPSTYLSRDGMFKDAVQAHPGQVTTIVARWVAGWNAAGTPNAPGTDGHSCSAPPLGQFPPVATSCAAPFVYEPVTSGPYVWHCHINSHEDSEMMRTSLVVP